VNAVSLYVERGTNTFRSVHVEAAERVAALAHREGLERLAHVSGIGADPRSPSPYIRSRGDGEVAVRRAFPSATVIRPAVMFGPGDAFVTPLLGMLRRTPAFPPRSTVPGGYITRQPITAQARQLQQGTFDALQNMDLYALRLSRPEIQLGRKVRLRCLLGREVRDRRQRR
jgi:uncharacterized protein YbjT (DUF2867 family)